MSASAPVVFISAATIDLKAWRDHLHRAFSRAGFQVLTQDESLHSALGDVRRLLAETVDRADCIIHLAGMGYGSHATDPFPDTPTFHCSWTQFEYYHAHEQKKDVIAFVCAPSLSATFTEEGDTPTDIAQKTALQEAHRDRIKTGQFTGTPLEGKSKRTVNEAVSDSGHLLSAVTSAVGTLHILDREASQRAQKELSDLAATLGRVEQRQRKTHHLLIGATALIVLLGLGIWLLTGKTGRVKEDTTKLVEGQKTSEKSQTALAAQLSQVQEALSKIQQNTDPKKDPVSQWPRERLEAELARQMQIKVEDLRSILAAGRTSLDALLQGQALLASGKPKEAGEKFDQVIQQEKEAAKRLRQAYEGKGQIADDAVRYDEALAAYQKAAALLDKTADPFGWADAEESVILVLLHLARYGEAEPLMLEVVHLQEDHLEPDNTQLAPALNNLANLYDNTNRLAEAEPLYKRALQINEKSYGPNDPRVAILLNNLAKLYNDTNRHLEAELLYKRALQINEKSYGPNDPKVALNLNNLAQIFQATDRLTDAEPLMQRALKINEKSYGPNHPSVAISLNNLAGLYQNSDRLPEAELLYKRALQINEKSYGPDHPDVALNLSNLARLYQDTNRLAEAEPIMRHVLQINEKSYGPDHPDVAVCLGILAGLYSDTNRLAEAEPLYKRALQINEKSYGPDHPKIAPYLSHLAQLYQATNRLAGAEPLFKRALQIDEKSYGPDHLDVALDLNNLAQLYKATNRLEEAEPLSRRQLVIFLLFGKRTEHPHPNTVAALRNYLSILDDQKLPEAKQKTQLESVAKDAGLNETETKALVAPFFGPFEVAVIEVIPQGQGPALGIKVGDIVRRYNGEEIVNVDQIIRMVGAVKGDAIPLEIQRGSESLKLTAKPGKLGLVLKNLPRKIH